MPNVQLSLKDLQRRSELCGNSNLATRALTAHPTPSNHFSWKITARAHLQRVNINLHTP